MLAQDSCDQVMQISRILDSLKPGERVNIDLEEIAFATESTLESFIFENVDERTIKRYVDTLRRLYNVEAYAHLKKPLIIFDKPEIRCKR